MEEWGNRRANEYFEANIPDNYPRPKESDTVRVIEKFIREKYEHKKFIAKSLPPKNEPQPQSEPVDTKNTRNMKNNNTAKAKPIIAAAQRPAVEVAPAPVVEPNLLDFAEPIFVPVATPTVQSPPIDFDNSNQFHNGSSFTNGSSFIDFGAPAATPTYPNVSPFHLCNN